MSGVKPPTAHLRLHGKLQGDSLPLHLCYLRPVFKQTCTYVAYLTIQSMSSDRKFVWIFYGIGPIVSKMKTYYTEERRAGMCYIQLKEGAITGLVTFCVGSAF